MIGKLPRSDRGAYVVLAGPDGCGKSTLARALERHCDTVVSRHWRPGLLPSLRKLRGLEEASVNPDPHGRQPDPPLKAWSRVLYYWLDFIAGYWILVRPACREGRMFLVERGWLDMIVDPRRYGLRGTALVRALRPFVPRPDVLLVLNIGPGVAALRKAELGEREVERQLEQWRGIDEGFRKKFVLDGELSVDVLVTRSFELLCKDQDR